MKRATHVTSVRQAVRKYGAIGVLIGASYLFLRWLWLKKRPLFVLFVLLVLAALYFAYGAGRNRTVLVTGCGPAASYSVTDLGTLSGDEFSVAFGINNGGQAVGYSGARGKPPKAVLWTNGRPKYLGALGGHGSLANGVNDKGEVAGIAATSERVIHGFLWHGGKMRDIGTLGGRLSIATGLNNAGQVVGVAQDREDRALAFAWSGSMRGLPGPKDCASSVAYGINRKGQIAGYAHTGKFEDEEPIAFHAIVWEPNRRIRDLGTLGGLDSYAFAINENGSVAGVSTVASSDSALHAFVHNGNRMQDLGSLEGYPLSGAFGINGKDEVVGFVQRETDHAYGYIGFWPANSFLATSSDALDMGALGITDAGFMIDLMQQALPVRAFLWRNGRMMDLNGLIPSNSPWELLAAYGINDKGQIIGVGRIRGQFHAFLLTPK